LKKSDSGQTINAKKEERYEKEVDKSNVCIQCVFNCRHSGYLLWRRAGFNRGGQKGGKAGPIFFNLRKGFVETTRKSSGPLRQMVEAERLSGKSYWDILEETGWDTYLLWIEQGLFQKYQPPNIENIKPIFRDKLEYTVPHHLGITSLILLKSKVPKKDWPTSYVDVCDPKWKGKLAISDPASAGPAVMFTRFMVELYGWDYFRKLGRNHPLLAKGNASVELFVMRGEAFIGINPNEFSVLKRIAEGEADFKVIYPKEGSAYYANYDAINKKAPHLNAAKLWMEFICSDEFQRMYAEDAHAIMPSQTIKVKAERPEIKFYTVDWKWIKENRDSLTARFMEEVKAGMRETK
jgi:ABC-type Fe3+ transport system substrate-binding protein